MMRLTLIDRYIGQHILGAFLVVLLVVVGLMAMAQFVDELGDANQYYTKFDVFIHTLWSLPGLAYEMLPISALVATLIGLGVLASHSELTILRASGLSLPGLLFSIMKSILLLAALALFLGEFGVPYAQQAAKNHKAIAESAGGKRVSGEGAWVREQNRFVHITAITPDGRLIGVTEHHFDEDKRLIQTLRAEQASRAEGDNQWTLDRVKLARIRPQGEGSGIEFIETDTRVWESELEAELLSVVLVDPIDLPISGLSTYAGYLEEQGVNATGYLLAFWNKLLQPVSILSLVTIGVAFIFGPLRSVTVGQRIITGVIVGLIFKFSQDLLAPASQVLGFSPLLAALVPPLISLVIGALLLQRAR